jgi:KUP system potassium uptake protein
MHADPSGAAAGKDAGGIAGHSGSQTKLLVLGALGVVYGDIGTSPIYAFRQALSVSTGAGSSQREVLGLLSLIVWALTLTVAVKYVFFVTRADNNGEGGTLSLMELARKTFDRAPVWITGLGVLGAALFFGDALITPAISVLSAVEGVKVVAPRVEPLVVPLTMVIIVFLFSVQRYGTAKVSFVFGPVIALWFLVLGIAGLAQIIANPVVLWAMSPWYGIEFLISHSHISLVLLGAIFLAVTGAEALYVDMGHFGRKPIVLAWFGLVFPCLLLNYFGQGAFVLSAGLANVTSPFFEMHPEWFILPFVALATVATVIASQAVITGTYSLARQAIALNMLPRMTEVHTSATQSGQIYLPQINTMLMIGVLILVPAFGSSDALSHAYGIAVASVMVVTLALLSVVMWRSWKWPLRAVLLFVVTYAVIDGAFLLANLTKVQSGGWVTLAIAAFVCLIMTLWIT